MSAVALWLIAAMLALGVLALGILFYLGTIRVPMIVQGEVKVRDIAVSREAWPLREKQVSNAFDNQFQLPVLFYVGALIALAFGPILLEAILAWAFVVSRYLHAVIHVTNNNVVRRFWVYSVGVLILSLFWLDLVVRLIASAVAGN